MSNLNIGRIEVIHKKQSNSKSYAKYTYIGITNPSALQNPFFYELKNDTKRNESIQKYRRYLYEHIKDPNSHVRAELIRLANYVNTGHNIKLVCYCSPKSCHGDVIKSALYWMITNGILK